MKTHAQAVVIGGGLIGCSILYHLAKLGWKDVVLLERDELTSGSTWHAAANLHGLHDNNNISKLQYYTMQLYKDLEIETGQGCGVFQPGSLYLAQTEQREHQLRIQAAKAKYFKTDFFPITEPVIEGVATRVMSLRDGTKKMSKSDSSDMSRINLTDNAELILKKIKKAKTDSDPLPSELKGLENRPEAKNLINIFAGLSGDNPEKVFSENGGKAFSKFKPILAELAVSKLTPISNEMTHLMRDPAHIDQVLGNGANKAAEIANPILEKTYDIMGLIRSR